MSSFALMCPVAFVRKNCASAGHVVRRADGPQSEHPRARLYRAPSLRFQRQTIPTLAYMQDEIYAPLSFPSPRTRVLSPSPQWPSARAGEQPIRTPSSVRRQHQLTAVPRATDLRRQDRQFNRGQARVHRGAVITMRTCDNRTSRMEIREAAHHPPKSEP
jgi:hypothetical protein